MWRKPGNTASILQEEGCVAVLTYLRNVRESIKVAVKVKRDGQECRSACSPFYGIPFRSMVPSETGNGGNGEGNVWERETEG